MLRSISIASINYGSSYKLVCLLDSFRERLQYFLNAFTRVAGARFPGRISVDAYAMRFTKAPLDSIYHRAPDDEGSLQDILFRIGDDTLALRNAFIEFAGSKASAHVVASLDLVFIHIGRIRAAPRLFLNYFTGGLPRAISTSH